MEFSVRCNSLTEMEDKLLEYVRNFSDCSMKHLVTEAKHLIKILKLEHEPFFASNEKISRWIKNTLEYKGIRKSFSTEKKSDPKSSKKNQKGKVI